MALEFIFIQFLLFQVVAFCCCSIAHIWCIQLNKATSDSVHGDKSWAMNLFIIWKNIWFWEENVSTPERLNLAKLDCANNCLLQTSWSTMNEWLLSYFQTKVSVFKGQKKPKTWVQLLCIWKKEKTFNGTWQLYFQLHMLSSAVQILLLTSFCLRQIGLKWTALMFPSTLNMTYFAKVTIYWWKWG